MMNRLFRLLFALLVCVAPLQAQQLKAHAKLFARAAAGDVKAVVQVEIDEGWHLYNDDTGTGGSVGTPTSLKWDADGITWSEPRFPNPKKIFEEGLKAPDGGRAWSWVHDGTILIYAKGHTDAGKPDLSKITLEISGLTCQKSCIQYSEELIVEGPGDDKLFANFPKIGRASCRERV